jgi:hypothetical protein
MMGALANKQTVVPVIDWSRHDVKTWLEQYIAWLDDNPIAMRASLGAKSPCQSLIDQMNPQPKKSGRRGNGRYDITDTEGFVLMKLLSVMERFESRDLAGARHVLGAMYMNHASYSEVARLNDWSVHEVRQLELLGVGWLACAMSGAFVCAAY